MLTPQGFKRKRYEELFREMEEQAKERFGEDKNTSEKSFLGILLRLFAWFLANVYQLAEKVYNSGHIDTATGVALDKFVARNFIKRRPAEPAKLNNFIIKGEPGRTVEEGFLVSREDGFTYRTTETVTLDENGQTVVGIIATQAGAEGNTPINTVVEIVNPTVGIDEVHNPEPVSGGREKETDAELRERFFLSSAVGSPSTNGIRASVLGVEGVRTAVVIENNTNEYDADGRPPKSFETFVLGGNSKDVAQAIFKRKAAGIEPYGANEEIVTDDSGNDHVVRFSYSEEVPIYINVELETNSEFPVDGLKRIRTDIIKYIGGLDEDGNEYTGLTNGKDVIFTQLVKIIYQTKGINDVTVLNIGISPDLLEPMNNIQIGRVQVATTDFEKVVVS